MKLYEKILRLDPEWRRSDYAPVQRWIVKLRRKGSVATLRVFFKLLSRFVQATDTTPDELVRLPKEEMARRIQSFCDQLSEEGKKVTAIGTIRALRSFLRANRINPDELELDASYRPVKRPEHVPTKGEVYRMANVAGSLKWRAAILCLFQSGLRNSALR